MSKLNENEVIVELKESLHRLNEKIRKMCSTLESSCTQEESTDEECPSERDSESDQIKIKL
jgi:hypothetical protein